MDRFLEKTLEKVLAREVPLEVPSLVFDGAGDEKKLEEYRRKIDKIEGDFVKYRRGFVSGESEYSLREAHALHSFLFRKYKYSKRKNNLLKTIDSYGGRLKGACFSYTSLYNILSERRGLDMGIVLPQRGNHILGYLETPKNLYPIENSIGEVGFNLNFNENCVIGKNNYLIAEYIFYYALNHWNKEDGKIFLEATDRIAPDFLNAQFGMKNLSVKILKLFKPFKEKEWSKNPTKNFHSFSFYQRVHNLPRGGSSNFDKLMARSRERSGRKLTNYEKILSRGKIEKNPGLGLGVQGLINFDEFLDKSKGIWFRGRFLGED